MAAPCLAPDCDLQALLDRPEVAEIALVGVFEGHFQVSRDVAISGVEGAPPPFLVAPDAWLGGVALLARESDLSVRGVGFVGGLAVQGGSLALELSRFDTTKRCLFARDAEVSVARTAFRTCGEGAVDLVGGSLVLVDTTFDRGFLPAIHAVGAERVALDRVVATAQLDGEPPDGAPDPVVWVEDAASLAASRTWVCGNAGVGLWVAGGCAGGCSVDHAVISRNLGDGGGGVVWDAPSGRLSRVTLVDNVAAEGGAVVRLLSGALAVDHAVVVDALATDDSFQVVAGELSLTESTVFSSRPGLPLRRADGNQAERAVFLEDPPVPDLCGPGAVPDPDAPENARVARWPEEEGRGALSTDCGPWCEDADGDGSPAMWDCAESDPRRGDDRPERLLDGVDQDCDGLDACLADLDGDGVAGTEIPVGPGCGLVPEVPDCDDGDPAIRPGAADEPADGVDQDCDGLDPEPPEPPGTPRSGGAPGGCATVPGAGWAALIGSIGLLRPRWRNRRAAGAPHVSRTVEASGCIGSR